MFTQHEYGLIEEAVLSDITKSFFTEDYFYDVYKRSFPNTPHDKIVIITKAGVQKWYALIEKVDEKRTIPDGQKNIINSIINNYCLKQINKLKNENLDPHIGLEIIENIEQYNVISDTLTTYPMELDYKKDIEGMKTELKKKLSLKK